jgi:hemolysin-activating ACP:hemolysin acyltransferase
MASHSNADKTPAGAPETPREPGAKTAARTSGPTSEQGTRFALEFSKIVTVLMRDAVFRNLRLADLERLVLPPLLVGQFRVIHAKRNRKGPFLPVAVALWARVSASIDKRLSEAPEKPPRLRAADWTSGSNFWIMVQAGDKRALSQLLKQLRQVEFKGQTVKLHVQAADGKTTIRTLEPPVAR